MNTEMFNDVKNWCAISCPVDALRFDSRTLAFLDSDGDGHIRTPEVLAAVGFMKSKGVGLEELFVPDAQCEERLSAVLARQKDLDALAPSEAELKALGEWEEKGRSPEVAVLGGDTAAAEAALAAVEKTVDAFFLPPDDMPLVTEQDDVTLPLGGRINPRFADAIADFAAKCVRPLCGEDTETLSRAGWKKIKKSFEAYRAWVSSKPVVNAQAKSELAEEERFLRYRMHLGEFLENYCTMDRLYSQTDMAAFQVGTLRIDGREMSLCFHVSSESAHSALAGKSNCCVIYLKLSRPSDKAERGICAVVTAGKVEPLYVGRNGVFYDRDGKDWEAVVTKVVENQVSLSEAFWSPWKKLAAGVSGTVKKFLSDRQSAGERNLGSLAAKDPAQNGGPAAMASSFAAIGVGVGLMGAALASVMAAVRGFSWWQYPVAMAVALLVVSLPSVALAYFKLRRRDLGAILNASGWAVNRRLLFSMRLAHGFTKCAARPCRRLCWALLALAAAMLAAGAFATLSCRDCAQGNCQLQSQTQETNDNAQAGK
jgi:hypothetical protein